MLLKYPIKKLINLVILIKDIEKVDTKIFLFGGI